MRTIRIYLDQVFIINEIITVQNQAFTHLVKVLRLKQNDTFITFNGSGNDYRLDIASIEKKQLTAKVISSHPAVNESPLSITLYQALTKSDHMDWTLQKSTELGVSHIVPFISERSQGRLNTKQLEKKQNHWSKIIFSACEQSGRATIPKLQTLISFETLLNSINQLGNTFVLHFDDDALSFNDIKLSGQSINIICGSEGGFSDNEIKKLKKLSINILSLGTRVLRTETAAISTISILQNKFGDMA